MKLKDTRSFLFAARCLAAGGLLFALVGCSGDGVGDDENAVDALAAAEAYYAAHPEFFTIATPEDLPADLDWEDGSDLPEFASPEAQRGGTLNDFMLAFPRTLRVIGPDANSGFRRYMLDDYSMRVVHPHPNLKGEYYPGLAEAWHIDWEGKRVFFKLDPKAQYTDGVKVTADDYLFLFYFMQQDYHQEPWSTNWYQMGETYTNITKYDDYTISIGVAEAKPDIFRLFEEDVRPVPRHHYKHYGPDFVGRYQWTYEPTTGPYVINESDVKKGRSIALRRLDEWWADDKRFWRNRFNPDVRFFQVIRDVNKAFEAFKKGEIDSFGLTLPEYWHLKLPNDAPEVQRGYIGKYWFYNDKPRPSWAIWINKSRNLLDNRDVRIGIAHALNFDLAIEQFFRGDYERADVYGEGYGEYSNPNVDAREFSVDKALESFAKAGFNQRDSDGILMDERGNRLSFELTNGRPQYEGYVSILREEARKAGLDLRIANLDPMTAYKQAQEKKHELTLTAYNTSVELYPRFFDFFHSYNGVREDGSPKPTTNNLTITAYPEWDALIERYQKSNNLEEIKEIAWEMQERIHEDAAYIPAHVLTYYRVGLWRWIRFPEEFDTRVSDSWDQFALAWIDQEEQEATKAAQRSGQTFEPIIRTFDQYRVEN